jgi:hypothetical protein
MLAAAVVSGVVALSVFGQDAAPPAPGGAPAAAAPAAAPPAEQAPPGAPAATPTTVKPLPAPKPTAAYKLRVADPAPAAGAPAPAVKKKLTFLGINTSPAPAHLREQLKLGRSVGLIVDAVDPGGPVEQAGLKPGDVIEKLDDQLLLNVEQFTKLVRSRTPGEATTLLIYRDGKQQTINATFGQKEVTEPQPAVAMDPGMMNVFPNPIPGGATVWEAAPPAPAAPARFAARRAVMEQAGRQVTEWADEHFSIAVERENGNTLSMVITDRKNGKRIYEGRPPEPKSLEQLFQVVPALRDKVAQADQAAADAPNKMQLKFFKGERAAGGAGIAPPMMVGGDGKPMPADVFIAGNGVGGFGQQGANWVVANPVGGRGRVASWQDDENLFVLRFVGKSPTYLLALSRKDGRTLYDGPVMTREQQAALPAEISEQFAMLREKPELAKELGAEAAAAAGEKAQTPGKATAPEKPEKVEKLEEKGQKK